MKNITSFDGKRKKYKLWESFSFAFRGIFKVIRRERNVKIHLTAGTLTVILGFVLKITAYEWLILILLIAIIISAEIMNSAVEAVSDMLRYKLNLDYYETYWIRNFAAGSVMVLVIAAVIIGLIIFIPKIFNGL